RWVGSVDGRTNVESWAESETASSKNVGAQHAAPLRRRMAGSADIRSERVPHRHLQRPRQDRASEEQVARATAGEEAQARVPFLEPLRLIDVEEVCSNRHSARRDNVLAPQIEIAV